MPKVEQKENKKKLLERIKADIESSGICPDLAQEATNLVMGVGSPDAEVMFIGEAPGKNEDLKGEPFVGAAGKFLDEMLELVGMKREDVYISNIVKYRPPNNRDPLPDEKKAFWPFLLREINAVEPKIVATLGRHSMEYFLPGMRISVIHGQPKRIGLGDGKVVILPLFHPAAALYNSSMRETLISDFQALPKIIELINNDNKRGK
ncbi:MAG TPA: uracil-DNA glycosylase [Candidatus Saccharimonadales bacterium]|nr:uracil-DNA glycosylase [Candidatus Saccharimonadales bacterium]